MNLPFRRKKNELRNRFYPGSHSYLRQSVPKQNVQIKINIAHKKLLIFILLFLIILVATILAINFLRTSKDFNIKNIDFATSIIDDQTIYEIESKVIGQNIFSFNTHEIEEDVKNTTQNVKAVIITKDLPASIRVNIDKYIPTIVAISFDTQIILDEELNLIESKELSSNLLLSKFQMGLLQGVFDLNSNDLQSFIISSLTPEEKEVFTWDKLTDENKKNYATRFELDTKNQINQFFSIIEDSLPENLKEVQLVRFYSNMSKEQAENLLDNSNNVYKFSFDLANSILKLNIKPTEFEWISPNSVRVILDSNKNLFFSFKRNIDDQLKDLETALVNGIIDGATNIDFRTVNFSSWN